VLEAIGRTAGVAIAALRADGGAAKDDLLLQLQADLSGIPVARPRVNETTALGAAALAGLAVGYWSEAEVAGLAGVDAVFEPDVRRIAAPPGRWSRRWKSFGLGG
jgi:glycerol kinase